MNAVVAGRAADVPRLSAKAWMDRAASAWLLAVLAGQALMAVYMAVLYGGAAVRANAGAYNAVVSTAWVAGDAWLNAVFALHLLFAAVILAGGALQLVPALRRAAPALHRWNGRLYLVAAFAMGVSGLVYLWTRATTDDLSQRLGLSLNGVLIVAFAVVAWRHARARRIDAHRRWALRLFVVVSGAWTFRVALMLWIVVNGGPVGFDAKTFTGPFLSVLAFAQYAAPLLVLEGWFAAQRARNAPPRWAMACVLAACALATAAGSAAAAMALWLPHL